MPGSIQELQLFDFSGGLNLRDAPSEMQDNEAPSLNNVTLDNKGAIVKRLGYTLVDSGTGTTNQNVYFWPSGGRLILKTGTNLYELTGSTLSLIHTFSNDSHVDFADFLSLLVVIHEADGVLTWTGAGALSAVANSPNGLTIEAWQNALWCAGNPTDNTLVTRSDLGAATFPVDAAAGLVTVNLRDVNDQKVINLEAAGWDGLLAFKDDVIHRIEDATTGANVTINRDIGTASNKSVVAHDGVYYTLSDQGVAASRGLQEFKLITEKVEPLFDNAQVNGGVKENWCAGLFRDRLLFCFAKAASSVNDLMLEWKSHPGFFVTHDIQAQAMAETHEDTRLTYHVAGNNLHLTFDGGDDNGAPIESFYQTSWFQPAEFHKGRWRRMRLQGRAAGPELLMFVRKDFDISGGQQVDIDLTADSETWGSTTWGGSVWAGANQERFDNVHGVGVGRSISFVFAETSSLVANTPPLNEGGASQQVGAWAINAVMLSYIPLGLS